MAALDFDFMSPNPDEMSTLFNNSPVKYVENVKIPVHLNLGTLDRRVLKTQGMEYYRNMKALGKNISVNIYEDNHPLSKVATHANILINAVLTKIQCSLLTHGTKICFHYDYKDGRVNFY